MGNGWYATDFKAKTDMPELYRAVLKRAVFHGTSTWDHEHCALCWAKFMEHPECLREGYCTLDEHDWICDDCFEHFRAQFEWKLQENTVKRIRTDDGVHFVCNGWNCPCLNTISDFESIGFENSPGWICGNEFFAFFVSACRADRMWDIACGDHRFLFSRSSPVRQ